MPPSPPLLLPRIGLSGALNVYNLAFPQLLDLSYNELSYVPPDLPEALEYLYLQHNKIAVLAVEDFLTTPNIRVIILR